MRARILNVLPAATYQMDRFLQLVDVVVSDRSATACVETGPQPRMHLNAEFVKKYCQRDEHLLMLILHEIYHIILGHSRLFPRLTEAHNIVFDAVINSMLCHQFREPQYFGFFQHLNKWDRFPSRILRPPPGWPTRSHTFPPSASEKEKAVINLLYGSNSYSVTYCEILELLKEELPPEGNSDFTLLGDHGDKKGPASGDDAAINDPLFKDVLRRITENWPANANARLGRGDGGNLLDFLMPKPKSPRIEFLKALKRLLDKAGILRPEPGSPYAWKRMRYSIDTVTALPNWRDRNVHSKEVILGEAPLLYKQEITVQRPRWTPQNVSHVYIDVSGSMENELPWLTAALDPLNRKGLCRLYAFSTVVHEMKKGKLLSERIRNTLGTDINCVYRHLLDKPARHTPRKIVVLTDGYTGLPDPILHAELERRKGELYIGIVGEHRGESLRPFAKSVQNLPKSN